MVRGKKGLSAVITTVLLIALALAAVGIIWVSINGFVKNQLSNAQSCVNVYDQVQVDPSCTCFNSTSNSLQFMVDVKNLDINGIIVAVTDSGTAKSFIMNGTKRTITDVKNSSLGNIIQMPGKNSGETYVYDLSKYGGVGPNLLELSPIINGKTCDTSSSVSYFPNCGVLKTSCIS